LVKFGKMQAIFNAARQAAANQASQIQGSASKMHFDILIKTPIIVFPKAMEADGNRDAVTAELGEIYASNKFMPAEKAKKGAVVNQLSAGLRNIRLISIFHYSQEEFEELQMLEKVDLDFKIRYMEHDSNVPRPDLEIEGTMSPINLQISQVQLKFLLELSKTIPRAFTPDAEEKEDEVIGELSDSTVTAAKQTTSFGRHANENDRSMSYQSSELDRRLGTWTKLDMMFTAKTVGLELILAKEDQPIGDIDSASLSKFAINDTNVKLRMLSDGAMESELLIHSFTIKDSRAQETKFRKIMSVINDDVKQQFMANISISGGADRHLTAIMTIDSPRVIFAMDYVFALVAFANSALATPETLEAEDEIDADNAISGSDGAMVQKGGKAAPDAAQSSASEGMSMSFRANIEDAQIILIANPMISNSEAIVLGTKQVLLSKQNATTLQITKIGMFLCRMDRFETSRLRILDDFSILMSMEVRSQDKDSSLTNVQVDIEPLVLRLSLRDILLALQIVNKASEMTSDVTSDGKPDGTEPKKIEKLKTPGSDSAKRPSSSRRLSTAGRKTGRSIGTSKKSKHDIKPKPRGSSVLKREEMIAKLHGIRIILIGDLHELPLIDWSIKKFSVNVRDWSRGMAGDTSFDTFVNVYNFSKSAWEPLIEPWQLGFHLSKEEHTNRLAVELYSHKTMELTLTSATIALASKSAQFLSRDEDVLSKPRGADAPYRIRNYSGFDINVWAAAREEDQGSAMKLGDGEEAQWRFEDPTTMRENLFPEGNTGVVGIKLQGSGFDSIAKIPVNREGETLYNLKPRQDKIQHRLLVEVRLGADSVKYITFRSPLLVENNTQIPIELGIFSPEEGHLLKIEKILPGDSRPAPVGAAFKHSLVIRPDQGFGYTWSNERLFWKDLLKRSTRTITCTGENSDQSPPFYFQMNANYDRNHPMTG
jgi:vacuolar protein sorting-associated protein 13A/C